MFTPVRFLSAAALASALVMVFGLQPARAVVTAPCSTNVPPSNMSPINGGTSTYCQTAFGWSDTWFPTSQPSAYDGHLDVLSGDNAPSLFYTNASGAKVGTGNPFNFLSPSLDGGSLMSHNIGGGATIVSDIPAGTQLGSASSTVSVGQVQIRITTTVNSNNSVTELFHFTNTGDTAITGLTFDDYYNFHPDGSGGAVDQFCGSTSLNTTTGTVTTVGKVGGGCSPVVTSGTMTGSMLPTMWDLGNVGQLNCTTSPCTPPAPGTVLGDIAAGIYNMATGPTGFGDTGADLVWLLGNLAAHASIDFTITKNFDTPTITPEPGSLALLGVALLGFGAATRRRLRRHG